MFDIDALLALSIVILGILGWAAFLRLMGGSEPVDLGSVFRRPWELAWPRGVQEEEPAHWRLDHLDRLDRRPTLAQGTPSDQADDGACDEVAAA